MVTERGDEYVLPVQVDAVELPGLAPTIGYLSAERYSPEQIADLLAAREPPFRSSRQAQGGWASLTFGPTFQR